MNKEIIRQALEGAKMSIDFIYTQGQWPKSAFRQYENVIHIIQAARKELDKDEGDS